MARGQTCGAVRGEDSTQCARREITRLDAGEKAAARPPPPTMAVATPAVVTTTRSEHGDDGEGMHGRGADHSHATGASYVERFLVMAWALLAALHVGEREPALAGGAARQLKTFRNHGLDGHLPPPLPPPPPASLPPLYRIHETDEEKRRDDANGARARSHSRYQRC